MAFNQEMTLYYVLKNGLEFGEMYKCPSNITISFYPRPIIGSYFLISGIILTIIYFPCFLVMLFSKCRAPSYQLMTLLAIFDLSALTINSIITGALGIQGASFCHYPLLIYCAGAIGLGSWMGGCTICILMALDRCVEINPHFPFAFIFYKPVFRFTMLVVCGYWAFATFFTNPVIFNVHYMSWFFDPNIGKDVSFYFVPNFGDATG